jgi:hypothetical protein
LIKASIRMDFTGLESMRKSGLRKAMRIGVNRAATTIKVAMIKTAMAVSHGVPKNKPKARKKLSLRQVQGLGRREYSRFVKRLTKSHEKEQERIKGGKKRRRNRTTTTSMLVRSIKIKVKMYDNSNKVVVIVGPKKSIKQVLGTNKKGKEIANRPARYAHVLEHGSKKMRAKPFVAQAYQNSDRDFQLRLGREVRREVASYRLRGNR